MSKVAADQWFEQRQDAFEGKLEARFNALGQIRWPQVLLTHTDGNIPADGVGIVPDALDRVTTDNGDGWGSLNFNIGGSWRAAIKVNNYGGPLGQGYELVLYVSESSLLYRKVKKVEGPETYRLHDWQVHQPF